MSSTSKWTYLHHLDPLWMPTILGSTNPYPPQITTSSSLAMKPTPKPSLRFMTKVPKTLPTTIPVDLQASINNQLIFRSVSYWGGVIVYMTGDDCGFGFESDIGFLGSVLIWILICFWIIFWSMFVNLDFDMCVLCWWGLPEWDLG